MDRFFNPVAAHIVFNVLSGAPQGDLAQGNQIALAEKVLCRPFGLLGHVNLAVFEALDHLFRRDVKQDDFVGFVKNRIGHGFVHAHAGDGAHRSVQAFQVLHIQRRPDVNTRL